MKQPHWNKICDRLPRINTTRYEIYEEKDSKKPDDLNLLLVRESIFCFPDR